VALPALARRALTLVRGRQQLLHAAGAVCACVCALLFGILSGILSSILGAPAGQSSTVLLERHFHSSR